MPWEVDVGRLLASARASASGRPTKNTLGLRRQGGISLHPIVSAWLSGAAGSRWNTSHPRQFAMDTADALDLTLGGKPLVEAVIAELASLLRPRCELFAPAILTSFTRISVL